MRHAFLGMVLTGLAWGQEPKAKPSDPMPRTAAFLSVESPGMLKLRSSGKIIRVRLIGLGDGTSRFKKAEDLETFKLRSAEVIKEYFGKDILTVFTDPSYPVDKDGAIPAYVCGGPNGMSINEFVLATGDYPADPKRWAKAEHMEGLEFVQMTAKVQKQGIWADNYLELYKPEKYEYFAAKMGVTAAGATLYLANEKFEPIYLCENYFAFMDCEKAKKAKDNEGIHEMSAEGRIELADQETEVKLIESKRKAGLNAAEVRIMSGEFKGKVFWVHTSDLATRREIKETDKKAKKKK